MIQILSTMISNELKTFIGAWNELLHSAFNKSLWLIPDRKAGDRKDGDGDCESTATDGASGVGVGVERGAWRSISRRKFS
jgi:hypothetical protein